jgi:SAM-dependent methyltransferase
MTSLPPVHIAIMQPAGYVHSLVFLDTARYVRHQFRRLGAEVSLAKNRLREDAINIVFGAHLGFPPAWRRRHACLFFNLEQLGAGGANVTPEYLQLLRGSAVVDYDPSNVSAYCSDPADVPIVPFLHAPYLMPEQSPPLEERPIDLLFFGSMNPRRRAFLDRVEASGLQVALFDHPVYGAERDAFIRQAKAVLNCHFYESSRFEQVRAFHCLSLGTPVISERNALTNPSAPFEDAVFWLQDQGVEQFFTNTFNTPAFFDEARKRLAAWQQHDPVEAYADLLAFGVGYLQAHGRTRGSEPWKPKEINLGSGKDYKPGWLNIDILDRAEPDLVLDLAQPLQFPVRKATRFGGEVMIEAGSVDRLYANNVLEHVPDLPALMTNVLALLKEGGECQIEVPYEKSPTAWQDPTHVRAMNENSWLYYTDWFWYLGWFDHRFEIAQSGWLDLQLKPCNKDAAAFMRITLRKTPTTLRERTVARTMRPDFGGVEDDWFVEADEGHPSTEAHAGVERS